MVGVVATGEETLGQGAGAATTRTVLGLGEGKELGLRTPVDQIEEDLVGQDRPAESDVGRLPAGQGVVRDPGVADFPLVEKLPEGGHGRGEGNQRVVLVDLVEVELRDPEPPE